jgi:hypothetical protein
MEATYDSSVLLRRQRLLVGHIAALYRTIPHLLQSSPMAGEEVGMVVALVAAVRVVALVAVVAVGVHSQ